MSVDLDHQVYNFVHRMEALGYLRDIRLYSYPHTREEIAEMLRTVHTMQDSLGTLSSYDSWYLRKYLGEFSSGIKIPDGYESWKEQHLLSYNYEDWKVTGDFHSNISDRISQMRRPFWHFGIGGEVRASYFNDDVSSLGGFLRMISTVEPAYGMSRSNFDPSQGVPTTVAGDVANRNPLNTAVFWDSNIGLFSFGQDVRKWGRGHIDALQLGKTAPVYNYFRYVLTLNNIRFTYLVGELRTDLGERYLNGHRLEWQPFSFLQLALSETIVYGDTASNRGLEWTYLNPLITYVESDYYEGEGDNNTASLEATVYPFSKSQLYLQWFIDDVNMLDWVETAKQSALLLGGFFVDPLGVTALEFTTEYVALGPWMYAHHIPINRYKHFDHSLGYPLQPNSERILIAIRKGMKPKWHLIGEFTHTRHGEGDIDFAPGRHPDLENMPFLGENVQELSSFTFSLEYEYFQSSYVSLGYEYLIDETNEAFSFFSFGISIDY